MQIKRKLLFKELQTGSDMFSTGVHQVLDVENHHDARVEFTKLMKSVSYSDIISNSMHICCIC